MAGIRIGIDVGGTFTDIVFLTPDDRVLTRKILSTPDDYSRSIRSGLQDIFTQSDLAPTAVSEVMHGTTVATNAILEGKGAKTGLITTKGFRDVLEIRRMRTNRLYDIYWEKPAPLVPRRLRREVTERVDYRGEVLQTLDVEAARREVEWLVAEGVVSIAVCFLHAYANPAHEQQVERLLQEIAPQVYVSISSRVLPELKEYERTSTTVINAYIRPVVEGYLQSLEGHLKTLGIASPLLIMQSNGGLMPSATAREIPMHIIESGPAAGVTGALEVTRRLGISNIMTLDIGGTTAKASLIEDGQLTRSPEYEVGGGMNIGHRLLKGGGYLLRVPAVDIAEVGAGGGSIASIDRGGSLQIGPQSAGADPGPACYNLGGEAPTLTDANVVLGYLNPHTLAGGTLSLDADKARQAIETQIAAPLTMQLVDAAWAIHRLADASMVRALRAVSTERGRDARHFALFAFGGKGPVHALGIAEALDMSRVVIPPAPGLFSSLALLFSDVEHHFVQSYFNPSGDIDLAQLGQLLGRLEQQGRQTLAAEGYTDAQTQLEPYADLRYAGQNSELTIPIESDLSTPEGLSRLQEAFAVEHNRTYGYRSDEEPIQLMSLRLLARGLTDDVRVPERLSLVSNATATSDRQATSRQAYFGPQHGWLATPLRVTRQDLAHGTHEGPLIIEEYDATTVILPGWRASLDDWSNLIIDRVFD
ncbi:MAG: hydantoinase/oxoprolinase family protein [bacterium]|nr:hydantoinase/oxoprolinase family protein [bacterium]